MHGSSVGDAARDLLDYLRMLRTHARRAVTTAAYVVGALTFMAASHAFAQSQPTKSVEIDATKPWTDTGVTVKAGESVTVTVDGEIHIGPGELDAMTPAGIP